MSNQIENDFMTHLLWTQFNDSVELFKKLSLNGMSDGKSVATAAGLLIARSRDESFFPPIECRWVGVLIVLTLKNVIRVTDVELTVY